MFARCGYRMSFMFRCVRNCFPGEGKRARKREKCDQLRSRDVSDRCMHCAHQLLLSWEREEFAVHTSTYSLTDHRAVCCTLKSRGNTCTMYNTRGEHYTRLIDTQPMYFQPPCSLHGWMWRKKAGRGQQVGGRRIKEQRNHFFIHYSFRACCLMPKTMAKN